MITSYEHNKNTGNGGVRAAIEDWDKPDHFCRVEGESYDLRAGVSKELADLVAKQTHWEVIAEDLKADESSPTPIADIHAAVITDYEARLAEYTQKFDFL